MLIICFNTHFANIQRGKDSDKTFLSEKNQDKCKIDSIINVVKTVVN